MKALPSVYINKVQKHNKFFYYELPDGQIIAKYNYDELLMNIEKLGFEILNEDGSRYEIEEGC
tara:strand:+ start:262 stop:450 length:189 start_codon:yes stop_codon:yes gene_type:complete